LESYRQFVDELLDRVKASRGVQGAAAGNMAPFAGRQFGGVFSIEGRPDPATQSGDWPTADVRTFITPDYLRVLSVPLLDGRDFSSSDTFEAPRVALLSRSLARAYWGDASPVGARIRFPGGPNAPWVTVVGVVADIKWNNLNEEHNWASGAPAAGWLRTLYVPFAQASVIDNNGVRLLVRSRTNPREVAANLGALVRSIDADTPVSDIRTTDALIGESVARPRFTAVLLTIFAGVGLLLGAIGVYGLVAYAVERRTQEFAVRLALGAEPRKVLRSVIAEGTRLAVAGVLVGLMIAALATRALSTLLFGVTPTDAGTLAAAALLLILIAIVASYIPARRAMRIDPSTALQRQ
jgi:putative ABC transport system permease protein